MDRLTAEQRAEVNHIWRLCQQEGTSSLHSMRRLSSVVDLTMKWEGEGKKHQSHHYKKHDDIITSCWVV